MRLVVALFLVACAGRRDAPSLTSLPAPHLAPVASGPLRAPGDLHRRVGGRDKRDPIEAAIAWASELGLRADVSSGEELVAWAERTHRLHPATERPRPGDLLVFDGVVAIAIARDARGITEFVYLAGGVVRRGFVDAHRPTLKRDATGAIVNTHLRHRGRAVRGKRALAGQLLANVVRAR